MDEKGLPYDEENTAAEDQAARMAMEQGIMEDWEVLRDMEEYCSVNVQEALRSDRRIWQMLAVLDRRIGKRTLAGLKETVEEQPEWLRFFYRLRLEAEGL